LSHDLKAIRKAVQHEIRNVPRHLVHQHSHVRLHMRRSVRRVVKEIKDSMWSRVLHRHASVGPQYVKTGLQRKMIVVKRAAMQAVS
jgi:hypothetical protein